MSPAKSLSVLITLSLFVLNTIAHGQERTWTSQNGKFSVAGTLVEQNDSSVKLKRSDNGKVVTVPLEKLSESDRDFLRSNSAKGSSTKSAGSIGSSTKTAAGSSKAGSMSKSEGSSTKAGSMSKSEGSSTKAGSMSKSEGSSTKTKGSGSKSDSSDLKIEAKAQWSDFPAENSKGEKEIGLELMIEAKGQAAKDAIEFGMINLKKCESSAGAMKPQKDRFRFSDPMEELVGVKRSDDEFFNEHPADGVRLTLKFDRPDAAVTSFTEVAGDFKIMTGGVRDTIKIENAPTKTGKIEDDKLKKLGAKGTIEVEENSVQLELRGKLGAIYDVKLVDKNGDEPDGLSGNSWSGDDRLKTFSFQFQDKEAIKDDLVLQLKTAQSLEKMTIPFSVTDIQIPAEK